MAKQTQPYLVRVCTGTGEHKSYISIARNGCHAVTDALLHFPDARSVSAKPVNTERA